MLELKRLLGFEVAGGSVDVFKCFDQINRELLFKVAKKAGMPLRILKPYFKFIDSINVRYQVGKYIGEGHVERCSIPQGCPFSMALIALLTRVWVMHMKDLHVTPRCLADDLMFTAAGTGHAHRTVDAMVASRQFFTDLGAKVASNKCFLFASAPKTTQFF